MLGESLQLGVQLRIEPVGLQHRGLEVVRDNCLRHAAEVPEGVLQGAEKILGRLPEHHLAVTLARVAQHDAQDVRLAPPRLHAHRQRRAVGNDNGRAGTEVHLGFLAGSALGRSLFDSMRHTILTAALAGKLPEPYTNERAIGQLYGEIIQDYVLEILGQAFPEQLIRIPEAQGEERADALIWFPDLVVLVEIKGVHSPARCANLGGRGHTAFLTVPERLDELDAIGVPKAVGQLAATCRALRDGSLRLQGMPSYDWTTKPIVPLVITEELLPQVPRSWETLYRPLSGELEELRGGCPLGRLRFLDVTQIELLPNRWAALDFGKLLYQWGASEGTWDDSWTSFKRSRGVNLSDRLMKSRADELKRFCARELGFDQNAFSEPPDDVA